MIWGRFCFLVGVLICFDATTPAKAQIYSSEISSLIANIQPSDNSDSGQCGNNRKIITRKELSRFDAEPYLWDLHKKERKDKNLTGAFCLALAALQFLETSEYSQTSDRKISNIGYGLGIIDIAAGIYEFLSSTPAKSKLKKIMWIKEIQERKEAGFRALRALNNQALTYRTISAMIATTGAFVFLGLRPLKETEVEMEGKRASPYNYLIGAVFAGFALEEITVKSPEEREYESFLHEMEKDKDVSLQLGIGLQKGRQVWVALRF